MPDVFKSTLDEVSRRLGGAHGVSLIGRDGLTLAAATESGNGDVESVAAEMTGILRNLIASDLGIETGALEQIAVVTSNAAVVLTSVTPEYFFLIVMKDAENLGRARFEGRRAAAVLEKELI
jgi:predicted regulator of Ras-like GTPase activity (Roadblock/LC7/MglB family)